MTFPMTFGRYWPGNSALHRMDPRAKLLLAVLLMANTFVARSFIALGVCALFTAAFFRIANIPLGRAVHSIAPLAFCMVLAGLLNIFFVQGGTVYVHWYFIQISHDGVVQAVFTALRLFLLLLGMSLLTLTTATLDITEAFEQLLKPARRIGVPAHELGMILGIALRFLPQFALEFQIAYRAQISRGASLSLQPGKGALRSLTSLLVPLFTSAFRHAETLSAAMDARCYHGGDGRSRLKPLHYSALDVRGLVVLLFMLAAVIAVNVMLGSAL